MRHTIVIITMLLATLRTNNASQINPDKHHEHHQSGDHTPSLHEQYETTRSLYLNSKRDLEIIQWQINQAKTKCVYAFLNKHKGEDFAVHVHAYSVFVNDLREKILLSNRLAEQAICLWHTIRALQDKNKQL